MSEQVHIPLKPAAIPARHLTPAPLGILQRKCACGGSGSPSGECAECKKKRMNLQRHPAGDAAPAAAPPIVHEVLRSPGQPLDEGTRAFFEPRFGHDFSRVRVHADGKAAQSTQAVNALAYTVGRNIVFGNGQFAPTTLPGRMLLAHELTHVVQQHGIELPSASTELTVTSPDDPGEAEAVQHAGRVVENVTPESGLGAIGSDQRHVPQAVRHAGLQLARSWNACGGEKDCPPRQAGERRRAAAASLQVGTLDAPEVGEIVSHFNIGSSSVRGLSDDPTWKGFVAKIAAEDSRWEILGFSDCEGGLERNAQLRRQRAEAVLHALPGAARSKIDRAVAAPLSDCVGENYTEWDRSLNRSVVFRRTAESITFPAEPITATPPRCVCGPDVTAQVAAAVASIGSSFAGWRADEKDEACNALDSFRPLGISAPTTPVGAIAWDIVELHNHSWIPRGFQPTCATEPAEKSCGDPHNFSVQIGQQCYYSGSVNYVIFGKMCKLCADYYLGIPLINEGYARFTRKAMQQLIDTYKGKGITGLATPSRNFGPSVGWAEAGYDGWPSGGSPPPGDCANCSPLCPTPYSGPNFRVNWYPVQFYTGGGGR